MQRQNWYGDAWRSKSRLCTLEDEVDALKWMEAVFESDNDEAR